MNILVVGESCLDEYIFGRCDRICPEAPAICFKSNGDTKSNLGMAGNVYNNLKALRPDYNIDIITNITSTIIKRRFIDIRYNTIVFRNDINDYCDRIDINNYQFTNYDGIIISDYCKGFLKESDISSILGRCTDKTITFMDTKKQISDFIKGLSFLKINQQEYKDNIYDFASIRKLCDIIITKGENGAFHFSKEKETHYPTTKIEIRDVCGAGDTFLASFAIMFLETHSISTSIEYANKCAGLVVSKFGVCSP